MNELLPLVVTCIRLHRSSLKEPGDRLRAAKVGLRRQLAAIWGTVAEAHAQARPGWIRDLQYPGYLCRTGSNGSVRVPFHLVPDFPIHMVDELAEIAALVRVAPNGTICISGSSTFLSTIKYAADLDYCEYLPVSIAHGESRSDIHASLANAGRRRSIQCVCTGSDVSDSQGFARFKYLTEFSNELIEATNLALTVERDVASPALKRSSALQEAPIAGSWIPQDIVDPNHLGEYACRLMSDMDRLAPTHLAKAAKRALSLCRVSGLSEFGDSLVQLLADSGAGLHAAYTARLRLKAKVNRIGRRDAGLAGVLHRVLIATLNNLDAAIRLKCGSPDELARLAQTYYGAFMDQFGGLKKRLEHSQHLLTRAP